MSPSFGPIINFTQLLNSAISTLEDQLSAEIAKRDTEISNLLASVDRYERELTDSAARILTLEDLIKRYEAEIERLKVGIDGLVPVDPPIDPIDPLPDISITLKGIGTFRPSIPGDRQGNETRYSGHLIATDGTPAPDIHIIIDIKDDGQIAVCFERCLSTLPSTAPVIETSLLIELGEEFSDLQASYIQPSFRLHHHTRPRYIINPSTPPAVNAQSLISSALIPNYDLTTPISPTDLIKISEGRYPWDRWSAKFETDPISEQYGQIINSWSGGAGPLLNEASPLMPVQVVYLLTQDPRAWKEVFDLANSSGNYAIHYKLDNDRFPTPSETSSLPFLQSPSAVTLKSKSGINLPIPEPAHEHSLVYLAYLLTGERYYREELEAWTVYNLLTRPKNDLRLQGIIWSGQIRAAAWSLRALLHLALSGNDAASFIAGNTLRTNLNWMADTFTDPSAPDYLSTGVCALHAFRPAPLLNYVAIFPRPKYFSTWHHHVLASVLNECVRAGFTEALPLLHHVTKVVHGQWENGLSPYHIGWGNHAFVLDNWPDIIRTTFEGATLTDPPRDTFPSLTNPGYVGWARSAVVAAVDNGEEWAIEALDWIDSKIPSYKGGVPLAWKINRQI